MKTEERPEGKEQEEKRSPWWRARAAGLPLWAWAGVTLAVVVFALGFGSWWTYGRGGRLPAVKGFYDGREVTFVHTEASDAKVANRLTGMVSSPVLIVPELTKVPDSALGNVYVFANGVKGAGPLGFQADVFDSAPTDPAYSPLRKLNLVMWTSGVHARVLTSAGQIQAAGREGEIRISRTGIVLNMPFLTWPGGHR